MTYVPRHAVTQMLATILSQGRRKRDTVVVDAAEHIVKHLRREYPLLAARYFKKLIDDKTIEYLFRGEPFGYLANERNDPRYHFVNEKPYEYDWFIDYYFLLFDGISDSSLLPTSYVYKFTTYKYADDDGNVIKNPRYIRNLGEYFMDDENIRDKYREEMETDKDLQDALISFYDVIGYEVPGEQGVWIFRPDNRKEISSTYVTAREALTILLDVGNVPTITPNMPQWVKDTIRSRNDTSRVVVQ